MKKAAVFICIFTCCFFLSNCNYYMYEGKRPYDYGAAKWVCQNPSAFFIVNPEDEEYYCPKGEMELDGQVVPFELGFTIKTNTVRFHFEGEYHDYRSFTGTCVFSPEKLIVKIDRDIITLFPDQYDELIFTRMPATEVTPLSHILEE